MKSGIINVLKPPGMSSGGVIGRIKHITGESRVGHSGTLDPAAAGVLPVCIGRATRLADILMNHEKEYIAEICFGASTDTLDAAGKILNKSDLTVNEEELKSVLPCFVGEIEQLPPIYSAIKINGKKAYQLARKGKDFELEKRKVSVYSIDFVEKTSEKSYILRVRCSKGTYVRTLLADIGEKLGVPAYTSVLIRSECGGLKIENALETAEIEELMQKADESFIIEPEKVLTEYEKLVLRKERLFALNNGLSTKIDKADGLYRIYCNEKFFGLGKAENGEVKLTIPLY